KKHTQLSMPGVKAEDMAKTMSHMPCLTQMANLFLEGAAAQPLTMMLAKLIDTMSVAFQLGSKTS
ncbi:hypothetical protein CROQUDRAFT_51710, partial [Cronartium quercuum f. sp. fusiforme G11]